MDRTELDVLCEKIEFYLDPDTLVEVLGLSTSDLVEVLRGHIADNAEVFEEIL